jgi:ATP-dependent helicase YprA (DUF1998 family)
MTASLNYYFRKSPEKQNLLSADILEKAQTVSSNNNGYCSTQVRRALQDSFFNAQMTGLKRVPYDWQLDVAEALLLGLDCSVIAGTGAGKTLPFVLPLFAQKTRKRCLIISPLNALEHDQASIQRFYA